MKDSFAIASWSGGKDSCFACYKALKAGYQIKYLLNFISGEYKRCCFHGIEAKLLKLQAEAVGIPLIQKEVSPDMKKYEQEFKEAVSELKSKGARQIVFGDIYLLDQINWVERVCKDLKIKPIEPLWNIPPDKIAKDFVNNGFKTVIVSAKADLLGEEFIGKIIDENLIEKFIKRKICPCGENGEFHTFVIDGPIFKKRIEIVKSQAVLKEGFWRHWFLDIQDYQLKTKELSSAKPI